MLACKHRARKDAVVALLCEVTGGRTLLIFDHRGQNIAVPTMFICPITQEILQNPVVAADG
eukprot:1144328-Pelagomonas_calceolata.AAC.3